MIEKTAIIVGGGPAGAACARKLQESGIDALIIDKKIFPRTKLCAGWVTPGVFRLLETDPADYPGHIRPFNRLICYFKGVRIPVPTRQYAIRRYEFDAWLLQNAGVPVKQHAVETIRKENRHYVIDNRYRARFLVGAGGSHCPVYQEFFSRWYPRPEQSRISTVEAEFPCEYRDGNCYLWFFENGLPGYSWYVPKAGGYLNIGIGGKQAAMKRQGKTINEYWRRFKDKLINSGLLAHKPEFSAGGHVYYIRRHSPPLQLGNAFLTGDAAGLATVDMGEGIAPAIKSGFRAARAIIGQAPCSMPRTDAYSWPRIIFPGIT